MRRLRSLLRRARKDDRGVTIVEFALVATPFLLLMMGLIDLGYRQYMRIMLNGAIEEAARQVTVGGVTTATVNTFITARMHLVSPRATIATSQGSYFDYTGIGVMEPITTDVNGNGVLDPGDCYTDYNGDNARDTNSGNSGVGGSDDIVYYTASATYASFVPIQSLFGGGTTETVSATTMMRNQPFGAQVNPQTVCV